MPIKYRMADGEESCHHLRINVTSVKCQVRCKIFSTKAESSSRWGKYMVTEDGKVRIGKSGKFLQ